MCASVFGAEKDQNYMTYALAQAQSAAHAQEVPVGAVVVDGTGQVISRAHNATEHSHTQAAHAEVRAMSLAGAHLKDWRLNGCWLYVTLEPCIMCMGLVYLSRLEGIVYGAPSPLFGCPLDNVALLSVYKVDALRIIPGVCANEASDILKQFFKKKRSDNGATE